MVAGDAAEERLLELAGNGVGLRAAELVEAGEDAAAVVRADERRRHRDGILVAALPGEHKVDRGEVVQAVELRDELADLGLDLRDVLRLHHANRGRCQVTHTETKPYPEWTIPSSFTDHTIIGTADTAQHPA